ncbi:MAG: peptide chain release factor 1 [Spirochaetes bacterium RBG_13_51_14]|nr:MAG: peptide chain release factor 1 [Spirochaetes bacterium RBG_13_51_14]
MIEKLNKIAERFRDLELEMSKPDVIADQNRFKTLTRERSGLAPIVSTFEEYKKFKRELEDAKTLVGDERDPEMKELLVNEITELERKIEDHENRLLIMLLPKDPNSGKDVIMEIRAGTGGEEAALFAADLFRMYGRYADMKGWKIEYLSVSATGIGGYKEIIFSIRSPEAYDRLKFESGGHRVQRVPATEAGGRIHTSAVTVAVLPEAEDDEVDINPDDLRIDVYRSSGHGGQSVNTTDSAVRITHIPTGMVVTCQDEKSQHKNKAKALRVLRARLLEKANRERMEREAALRKSQVGSGDRSERIRTYNFPQSRVTDHRIGLTLYSLDKIMEGYLDAVVEPLKKHEIKEVLKKITM